MAKKREIKIYAFLPVVVAVEVEKPPTVEEAQAVLDGMSEKQVREALAYEGEALVDCIQDEGTDEYFFTSPVFKAFYGAQDRNARRKKGDGVR